ncbi:MAG: hypothetical protein ACUZ8H_01125 [Candidatus Anammoxibacter sp.]
MIEKDGKMVEKYQIEDSIYKCYSAVKLQTMIRLHGIADLITDCPEDFKDFINCGLHEKQEMFQFDNSKTPMQAIIPKKKAEQAKLLAEVYYSKKLFFKLLEKVDANVRSIFEILTWDKYVNVKALEERFRTKIMIGKANNYYGSSDKTPDSKYQFFLYSFRYTCFGGYDSDGGDYDDSYDDYEYFLYLDDPIREQFKNYFTPPAGYDLKPLNEVDANYVFEDNGNIFDELPVYIGFLSQGLLEMGKNRQPLKNSFKRMKEVCGIAEFYKDDCGDLAFLRTKFISSLLLSKNGIKDFEVAGPKPTDLLKSVFQQFEKDRYSISENFLLHLKGRTKCFYDENNDVVAANLIALLRDLPINKWVSAENLCSFVKYRDIDLKIIPENPAEKYLYYTRRIPGDSYIGRERQYVIKECYYAAVIIPMIKASMFFFASIGLVDVAFGKPVNNDLKNDGKDYFSIFDGLQYVRLTDPGAYIVGKTKKYVVNSKQSESADIIPDEERLIAYLTGPDKLKEMFLSTMADEVSSNVYRFSYSSILKNCAGKNDIEESIKLLKDNIAGPIPEIWSRFFKDIFTRCKPLKLQSDMSVYKIANNRELTRLIVKDSILKKIVLKVEDYHIAIKTSDIALLEKRLKSLGFLI